MKIAVLSGKGGTGKTTIAASLSASLKPSQYVDCDVEEPNGHIFLNPDIKLSVPVKVEVPDFDESLCSGCGDCAEACRFHALAAVNKKIVSFPEICHHCGACYIVCKTGALTPAERIVGVVEMNGDKTFARGKLNVGEPISIPVIKKLKEYLKTDMPVILDCPPGASCAVVQSLEGCDFCLLVTEPTPFGLHDLKIAVALVRKLGIPFCVALNKAIEGDSRIQDYCKKEGIEIIIEIPYSREIAESYSDGVLPVHISGEWKRKFARLYDVIKERVSQ